VGVAGGGSPVQPVKQTQPNSALPSMSARAKTVLPFLMTLSSIVPRKVLLKIFTTNGTNFHK
jgi:hypothetical protein